MNRKENSKRQMMKRSLKKRVEVRARVKVKVRTIMIVVMKKKQNSKGGKMGSKPLKISINFIKVMNQDGVMIAVALIIMDQLLTSITVKPVHTQ